MDRAARSARRWLTALNRWTGDTAGAVAGQVMASTEARAGEREWILSAACSQHPRSLNKPHFKTAMHPDARPNRRTAVGVAQGSRVRAISAPAGVFVTSRVSE
jgi:hypothetical protein